MGTTLFIVLGATLATAAHGADGSASGLFWFLTIARGITGIVSRSHLYIGLFVSDHRQGVGGEYPASSTSASESANEKSVENRGPSTPHVHLHLPHIDPPFLQFLSWPRNSFLR